MRRFIWRLVRFLFEVPTVKTVHELDHADIKEAVVMWLKNNEKIEVETDAVEIVPEGGSFFVRVTIEG